MNKGDTVYWVSAYSRNNPQMRSGIIMSVTRGRGGAPKAAIVRESNDQRFYGHQVARLATTPLGAAQIYTPRCDNGLKAARQALIEAQNQLAEALTMEGKIATR